jgi:hypothetical protein
MNEPSGPDHDRRSPECTCDDRVYSAFFNLPVNMCASEKGRTLQIAQFEARTLEVHLRCGLCGRPFDADDIDARAILALATETARDDVADLLPVLRQMPITKADGGSGWVARRDNGD